VVWRALQTQEGNIMMNLELIKTFEVVTYKKRVVAQYVGDKRSNICPRCGHRAYYYRQGGRVRRKACSFCNFDSSMNEYSRALKTAARRGNLQFSYGQDLYDRVVEYQRSLVSLSKETTGQ